MGSNDTITNDAAPSGLRARITRAATSPFQHAPYPLARTLEFPGDPGLLGPDSVSWRVLGDVAAFVGGIRGLLVQAAHPEVVAGVGDHSRYQEDPLGRLSRTSAYVTATTYGAMPEVDRVVGMVRKMHGRVTGVSDRGRQYSAGDPPLAAWVHNALTDSFLVAHQAFGAERLTAAEADQFVAEQARIGRLLDAEPIPETAGELADWIADHPEIEPSPSMAEAIGFLTDPPLAPSLKAGYLVLMKAAVTTLPDRITEILGIDGSALGRLGGHAATKALRWALGSSPSWNLALVRTGAEVPEGVFHQPLPVG